MRGDGLRVCAKLCMVTDKQCDKKECRHFIDYPDELNCVLITVFNTERDRCKTGYLFCPC